MEPKGGEMGTEPKGGRGMSLRGGQKTTDNSWIKSRQILSFCESPMTSSLPFLPPPLFRVLNFFLFFTDHVETHFPFIQESLPR